MFESKEKERGLLNFISCLSLILNFLIFKYVQNLETCLKEEKERNEKLKIENEELKNKVKILEAEVRNLRNYHNYKT